MRSRRRRCCWRAKIARRCSHCNRGGGSGTGGAEEVGAARGPGRAAMAAARGRVEPGAGR